jgi:hypothetical protein
MCRRILPLAVLVLVMLSDLTWAERRQEKQIASLLHADRFDMGVQVHVVRRKVGAPELIPGVPLEILRTHRFGHMCRVWAENGKKKAAWCGRSAYLTTWFVSEAGEEIVLHPDTIPKWQFVQGSEGSSKTVYISQWLYLQGVLPYIGMDAEAGFTAPIEKRIEHVRREIAKHWPAGTYRYNAAQKLYAFHAGPRVQLVSAHVRSEAEGSPLQGYSWTVCASDELQDHHDSDADIIARVRDPKGSRKRLCSSTFKDSTEWRNFKARAEVAKTSEGQKMWLLRRLLGLESPFIPPERWDEVRAGYTDREWRRRVLAEDVGPERQVYYSFRRVEDSGKPGNLRPLPLNAVDVTARELARYGKNNTLLIGHDPGQRQHATEILKAYEFPNDKRRLDAQGNRLPPIVRWFVVDEITSDVYNADEPHKIAGPVTVERHVECVLKRVREKWGCLEVNWRGERDPSSPGVVVRIDPHTTSGAEHPDRLVYTQWRAAGFTVFAAAYNAANKPTPIKVDTRIDLLNTLFCNVERERRLHVLSDDRGQPVAPMLVKALETMERDESGRAEWENKDASDLSHWPAAVAFGLMAIEKPRIDDHRNRAAKKENAAEVAE